MTRVEEKVDMILSLLLAQVRHTEQIYRGTCQGEQCIHCRQPHREKIRSMLVKERPLILILPAFPAKSANRQKTISSRPDLGEAMSLQNLNDLCLGLHAWHEPGVKLFICSDGRVFNDLVLVSDEEVELYQQGIKDIIHHQRLNYIKTFSLDEVYPHRSYGQMREHLMADYGESLTALKERLFVNPNDRYQFNGIHRFVYEDQLVLLNNFSKNKVREQAKHTAYEVVRRSNAWSRLLSEFFPYALRLSIHPQPCGSEKLGIQFLPTNNRWATPWHNVLLKKGNSWQLIKRIEAEQMGARLNQDHYILETYS